MPKFLITDSIVAEVNYRYVIEAETANEAMDIWRGDAGSYLVDYDVGDQVNYPTPPLTVVPMPE